VPVITLTSDFGEGSPYVAAMKARLLEGCPGATLVDVSHSVPPFNVRAGAFVLWAGTRHFAPGAVHLAVVDPGVGGARRGIAFSLGGARYVGPDNGLFDLVVGESGPETPVAVSLIRPVFASPTFEGRDVFAPAAAALAAGAALADLGPPASGVPARSAEWPPSVVWVDRFGNLITSLRPPVAGLRVGSGEVRLAARTFSEAPPGVPFFYVGSMGFIEVAVREGSAAEVLNATPGTPVERL
jgi:S-adenosylmethionine hydrolase